MRYVEYPCYLGYEAAATIFTRETFPQAWAMTQNNLGTAYLYRIFGERGENLEVAIACFTAANTAEISAAIALFQQSLEIKEQIGDLQGKAATLHQLGRLIADRGEIEEAIALFQKSLEIQEQIGDVQSKAATLHQLGRLLARRGYFDTALAYLQESLKILQQSKSPDSETVREMLAQVQQMAVS